MSDREKRLSIVLLAALFLIGNLAAVKLYFLPKLESAKAKREKLEDAIQKAELGMDLEEEMGAEMDWLQQYEPQPILVQDAESKLEEMVRRQASGLEIKSPKILAAIEHPSLHYHRARLQIAVTGREQYVYRWLDRLHSPKDFRAVTMMEMNPVRDDDTQVDCSIVVEQWFVPLKKSS